MATSEAAKAPLSFWDELRSKQRQYEEGLKNAVENGKETGWVRIHQSEVDLRWRAERSDAAKFEKITGRPRKLDCATADDLVKAMHSFLKTEAAQP